MQKSVLFKDLLEQGVRYITDIYENCNKLLSYTELKNRIITKINFIQYSDLTKAVQHYLKQMINNCSRIMTQNTLIQLK